MTLAQHRRPIDQIALTVASVPSGHVYVRHLSPVSGPSPTRLPDPDPANPVDAATGAWWPPVMLEPEWAATAEFDLFHLHFGFDACSPAQLSRLLGVLRDRGKPFVFTVHDLRNPHHQDRAAHDEQLDVLVPGADALVTLTPGAASEIERRWGRSAEVVSHPHVVELATMGRVSAAASSSTGRPFRVGVHVKSLRASMDPLRVLPTLVSTVAELDGAVLQVNGHRDVLDTDGARQDAELASYLRREHSRGTLELVVHDYLSDAQLWAYLASLDVSVLPYRFGTHSGWLEACRDLQTTVVAPTCGYFSEQGPVLTYVSEEHDFDAESLRTAVVRAFTERPRLGASIDERSEQRRRIAESHDSLYRSLLA